VKFVLEFGLGALGTGTDGFGVVAVERSGGFGMVAVLLVTCPCLTLFEVIEYVQTWAILVKSGNQQCHTERSGHNTLLSLSTLTKPQGQIAYGLCTALHSQRFVVMECVGLGLDSCVLNHASGISLKARHSAANVAVYFYNLFDGRGFEEGGGYALFDTEDNAFRC